MEETLVAILVPIGVCVILPIAVVWIVMAARNHSIDRKTELLLKAMENGQDIDPELVLGEKKTLKSIKVQLVEKMNVAGVFSILGISMIVLSATGLLDDRADVGFPVFLLCGIIFTAIGLGTLITYFVGRRTLKGEMEAELEKQRLENEAKSRELEK